METVLCFMTVSIFHCCAVVPALSCGQSEAQALVCSAPRKGKRGVCPVWKAGPRVVRFSWTLWVRLSSACVLARRGQESCSFTSLVANQGQGVFIDDWLFLSRVCKIGWIDR
jgi:hypothetical protein